MLDWGEISRSRKENCSCGNDNMVISITGRKDEAIKMCIKCKKQWRMTENNKEWVIIDKDEDKRQSNIINGIKNYIRKIYRNVYRRYKSIIAYKIVVINNRL